MLSLPGGVKLTPSWLERHVFPTKVIAELEVVAHAQGRHSITDRIIAHASTGEREALFCKRSTRAELPERSEEKWVSALSSYRAETCFFGHVMLKGRHESGDSDKVLQSLCPTCYYVHQDDSDGREAYMIITEDLTSVGWYHPDKMELSMAQAKLALDKLAWLHGRFWCSRAELDELVSSGIHQQGSFWSLDKRENADVQNMVEVHSNFMQSFQRELSSLGQPLKFVSELAVEATVLDDWMCGRAGDMPRTLVHGDFKAGNFLFSTSSDSSGMKFVDLQWCGEGPAVADIAYLIATSLHEELLELPNLEKELLQHYHECLLGHYNGIKYSFADLQRHYNIAQLDYIRCIISCLWKDLTPAKLQLNAAERSNSGMSLISRSLPHVRWILRAGESKFATVHKDME